MAASFTAALIAAAVLGVWFTNTRSLAIGAVAILTFVHPWLIVFILLGAGAAFYFFRIRK
nr:hypothetical protein [uncultured Rhodoferax sp.]